MLHVPHPLLALIPCALLAAAPTAAQQEPRNTPNAEKTVLRPDLWRTSLLIGKPVVDRDGNPVGAIADVVIDMRVGFVNYAVVENDHRFAVRLDRFRVDTAEENAPFVLDFSKPEVDRMPKLEDGAWPASLLGLGDIEDRGQIMRASTLMDMNVENWLGETLGEIEEIVLDCDDRYVAYAVLGVREGFLDLSEKYFAIPLHRTRYDESEGLLRMAADPEDFTDAPTARITGVVHLDDGLYADPALYWVSMDRNLGDVVYIPTPNGDDVLPHRVVDVWWIAWNPERGTTEASMQKGGPGDAGSAPDRGADGR